MEKIEMTEKKKQWQDFLEPDISEALHKRL